MKKPKTIYRPLNLTQMAPMFSLQNNRLLIFICGLLFFVSACGSGKIESNSNSTTRDKKNCLYCIHDADENVALLNEKGDTIAPFGRFDYCFFDSTDTYGTVYDHSKNGFFAYDVTGKELFQVMTYDNGPDYVEDGMFRIVKDQKIGYANEKGEIIIEPQFECAWPFEKGKAEVSYKCTIQKDGEHTVWIPDSTFFIDKKGNPLK